MGIGWRGWPEVPKRSDFERLVKAAVNREEWAVKRLVDIARPVAAGTVNRLLGNSPLAEDHIQEATFGLFLALPRFDPTQDFMPWARAVLRNKIIDGIRKADRFPEVITDPEKLPVKKSETSIEERALIQVLRSMPRDWARAVILSAYQDLTFAEMSAMTGVPAKTWYSRYRRGIEFLRDEIESWQ